MTRASSDDLGKPIRTAEGNRIGTLREVDGPTIYVQIADDIDQDLLDDMKIAETTAQSYDGAVLAGASMGAIESVTDDEIRFWPAYAAESRHEPTADEDASAEDTGAIPEGDE